MMPRLAILAGVLVLAACGGAEPPKQPSPDKVVVAALGDSITAGSPLWDPDPAVRDALGSSADPESQYGYWAQLAQGNGASFRNCGVPGERTDQIAQRLEPCAEGADVLLVQGGINDIAQMQDVERIAANLRRMVRRGRELGLGVALVDVLPWNNGFPVAAGPIRRLNRLIRAIGREEDVPVYPFHDTLEDPARPGRMKPEWTIDGDHPSVEGYRRMGRLIELEGERPVGGSR